jgi:DNA-binding NarL/FixJ family response regulator
MDANWSAWGALRDPNPATGVTFDAVLDGSIRVVEMQRAGMTCRLVVSRQSRPAHGFLSLRERSVVRRLALGQCQKLVAYDFGLAHTTVSSHLRAALDKLGLTRWEHVVLVAAVMESMGAAGSRVEPIEEAGDAACASGDPGSFFVIRCELSRASLRALTEAERAVALLVVDGCANNDIGRTRTCSPRTVANQISSVFRKLHVHGRCELIRWLVLAPQASEFVTDAADTAPQSSRRVTGISREEEIDAEIATPTLPAGGGLNFLLPGAEANRHA